MTNKNQQTAEELAEKLTRYVIAMASGLGYENLNSMALIKQNFIADIGQALTAAEQRGKRDGRVEGLMEVVAACKDIVDRLEGDRNVSKYNLLHPVISAFESFKGAIEEKIKEAQR